MAAFSLLPQAAHPLASTDEPVAVEQVQADEFPSPAAESASRLKAHLSRYEAIRASGGWPAFPEGGKLEEGMRGERVALLRQILTRMGDYPATEVPADPTLFDAVLRDAVKRFQSRHALEADGSVGTKTQKALAVTADERVAQMKATLERMQGLQVAEGDTLDRYIVVNVPGFYLNAFENGERRIDSKIIVGRQDRATPLFTRDITHISFNPEWHVPSRIASHDLLAKAKRDPEFFRKGRFQVVMEQDGEKVAIDPDSVDWSQVDARDFPFRLKQASGSDNALGKIKFTLPDTDSIYLHSTSQPQLFAKAARNLSSGCIRVEQAQALAHFVMGSSPEWTAESIDKLYNSSRSRIVKVDPVPVYVVYWTSWVDPETDSVHFNPDIYGRDRKRIAELMQEGESTAIRLASNSYATN